MLGGGPNLRRSALSPHLRVGVTRPLGWTTVQSFGWGSFALGQRAWSVRLSRYREVPSCGGGLPPVAAAPGDNDFEGVQALARSQQPP